jgi:ribosomal protein S18 acetylase RimI-like enzyme
MKKIVLNNNDILVYREGSGNTTEIYDIVVNSDRRVGNGRKLVTMLLNEVDSQRVFAFTRAENHNAQQFYSKLGFKGYDVPRLYPDGDAMIFIYERS